MRNLGTIYRNRWKEIPFAPLMQQINTMFCLRLFNRVFGTFFTRQTKSYDFNLFPLLCNRWKLSQLSKVKENQHLSENTFHDISEKHFSLFTEEQKERYVYLAENFNHTSHEPKIFIEQNPKRQTKWKLVYRILPFNLFYRTRPVKRIRAYDSKFKCSVCDRKFGTNWEM